VNGRPRAIIPAALAGGLTSCDQISEFKNPGIRACKTLISEQLKAPSSLHIISTRTESVPITVAEWNRMNYQLRGAITDALNVKKPGLARVVITYDASNSFAVPIRAGQICDFPVKHVADVPSDLVAKTLVNIIEDRTQTAADGELKCCTEAFAKVN
jgi:hypothetical protein